MSLEDEELTSMARDVAALTEKAAPIGVTRGDWRKVRALALAVVRRGLASRPADMAASTYATMMGRARTLIAGMSQRERIGVVRRKRSMTLNQETKKTRDVLEMKALIDDAGSLTLIGDAVADLIIQDGTP